MISRKNVTFIPKRYLVTILVSLGSAVVYILHLNISIALVEMTSSKIMNVGNTTVFENAPYDWSPEEEGILLSTSSYGVLLSPIGGVLGTKFGGATVFGLIVLINAIGTILVPLILRIHVGLFVAQRVVDGVIQGFVPACMMEVFSHWAPPEERSRLIVCGVLGIYVGAAINYPLCGFIAQVFDWESIYYATGVIAVIWYIIWFLFVTNDPSEDKFISDLEKSYLKEKIAYGTEEKVLYPWKRILTSKAVWAYINEFFVLGWSFSFILLGLPMYVKDMLNLDIETIGIISSLPDISTMFSMPIAAFLADYLRGKGILSVNGVHKLFITFGQLIAVSMLVAISFWQDFMVSILLFSIFRFCYGFAEASYEVLPADLTPRYSGVVRGIATTGQAISLFLSPTIMGFMVTHHNREEWSRFFLFLCSLNIWGAVVFFFIGSGKTQSWAELSPSKVPKCETNVVNGPEHLTQEFKMATLQREMPL